MGFEYTRIAGRSPAAAGAATSCPLGGMTLFPLLHQQQPETEGAQCSKRMPYTPCGGGSCQSPRSGE